MGIEWFRDLTIIIFGLATTLARHTAEMVHGGVKPTYATPAGFKAMHEGYQRDGTSTRKHSR